MAEELEGLLPWKRGLHIDAARLPEPGLEPLVEGRRGLVLGKGGRPRVEKFDRRGTEPNELLNIRIRAEILSEFRKMYQNSSDIQKFEI